jgi:hypothetical protein
MFTLFHAGSAVYLLIGCVVVYFISKILHKILYTILIFGGLYWAYNNQDQVMNFVRSVASNLNF